MDGLAIQLLGEGEQHLRHLAARLQPVRARAVIPLPETLQFEFKPQLLNAELFGLLPAFLALRCVFPCLLRVASPGQVPEPASALSPSAPRYPLVS